MDWYNMRRSSEIGTEAILVITVHLRLYHLSRPAIVIMKSLYPGTSLCGFVVLCQTRVRNAIDCRGKIMERSRTELLTRAT